MMDLPILNHLKTCWSKKLKTNIIYVIIFLLIDNVSSTEIDYYWSGAVTINTGVVSVATDSEAEVKVQYSDTKDFSKNNLSVSYTHLTLPTILRV